MALSLSITQPSGVVVTYWKVSKMVIDNVNLSIQAEISGYLNQSACIAGNTPVITMVEVLNSTQYASILAAPNMIAAFYTVLSQLPDFLGSTVVP
jgi:hypothetical protein